MNSPPKISESDGKYDICEEVIGNQSEAKCEEQGSTSAIDEQEVGGKDEEVQGDATTKRKRVEVNLSGSNEGKKSKRKKCKSGGKSKKKCEMNSDSLPLDADYIDKLLEEKALRNNLSAINVKNILRYVVTNEHVLAMVRNSVRNDGQYVEGSNEEAAFEPKLTRSKAKELIEKQSAVPWPISPIKVTSSIASKKLIEEEFAEDECSSDEEYMPSETIESEEDEELDVASSPATSDAVKLDPLVIAEESEEDMIALRTRSKLPLVDTPLESIEASFIAPDITIDMYDSDCDDEDWKGFLHEFLKPIAPEVSDALDDELVDPEYNFLEEEDVPDSEDLRDDHRVKITKKELNALMKELLKAAEAELVAAEDDISYKLTSFEKEEILEISPLKAALCEKKVEDAEEALNVLANLRVQLDDQMRKHIQLLTQVFVLTSHVPEFSFMAATCKSYVVELYNFSSKSSTPANKPSAFTAQNLKEAAVLVSSYTVDKSEMYPKNSKRVGLPASATKVFSESKIFIYTELLPTRAFVEKPYKHSFSEAEDNLLAFGLEQFLSITKSPHTLIKGHMLPVKTEKQIMIRSKNLRTKRAPDNPVKYLCVHKRLKPLSREVTPFDENALKPPLERTDGKLPEWLRHMVEQRNIKSSLDLRTVYREPVPGNVALSPKSPATLSAKTVAILPRPSPPISAAPRISPLKTVSPILKKYSHTRNGGSVRRSLLLPKMLPRMMYIAPVKSRTFKNRMRPLAPKPTKDEKPVEVAAPEPETKEKKWHALERWKEVQESESDNEAFDDADDTADEETPDVQDSADDLAALMVASTTIQTAPRHRPAYIKRNKHQREMEMMSAILVPDILENDPLKDERENALVASYISRVKQAVGANRNVYEDFLKLLHNFTQTNRSVVQLYEVVCQILHKFPELCDEFVGFMRPDQAEECGKLMEYLSIVKMKTFLRKLEVNFSKHPQHIQKIVKVMSQFEKHPSLTINDLRTAIVPLFRGQTHLAEELFSLFPQEPPPESAMTDFEEVDLSDVDEDDFVENVHLPDCEDSYGGHNCGCQCHLVTDKLKLHNRLRHCVKCGIKFVDGRVFLQAGKMLRPCHFVYAQSEDEKEKLSSSKKPSAKESEGDFSPNSPVHSSASSLSDDYPEITSREDEDEAAKETFAATEDAILATDKANGDGPIPPADFSSIRSVIGSNVERGDEAGVSIPAKNHSVDEKGDVVVLWTRESDRMILQSCQQVGPSEETFRNVAAQLPGKTPQDVHARFLELISLFSNDYTADETR